MRQCDSEAGNMEKARGKEQEGDTERETQRPVGRNRAAAGLVDGVGRGKGQSIHLATGHHMAQSCIFVSHPGSISDFTAVALRASAQPPFFSRKIQSCSARFCF